MSEQNEIALITGASRGLGRSMAEHLARKGIDPVITYHSRQDVAEALVASIEAAGGRAAALSLDTAQTGSFTDFAERLGGLLQAKWQRSNFDFLVNNAGFGAWGTFETATEEDFDSLMNVHLKGPFFLTQKLLPLLVDGGRILNVSSGLTRFALPGFAAYAAMKGGVEVLTLYLAKELGARGIAVNTIAPGAIETDFGGGMVRDNKEVNDQIAAATAMGRVGLPDDIGGPVAALLSGETGWVTAQRIEVSGGQWI
jgi:NAD(P)-dependent dehydrogenase (short-subunit alcohol dehydrogenase family)